MSLSPGTRLGPYEIVSALGAGGMGQVYRARDTRLERDVAIKVLPEAVARDADRLARFEREARSVAAINHPNILAVHDVGTADVPAGAGQDPIRTTYMVTELLEGETLRARLADGPLPVRKAVDVAIQIARGLAAAHDRGIVHRDLKPDNIVLLRDGHVKILDFGLAKQALGESGSQTTAAATDAGTVLGTAGYMAPEQVRGEVTDARTDLFALGCVFYELVSGQRAFARATPVETMAAILREEPPDLAAPPVNVSPALAEVARHALEKSPPERFQSARDFAFALKAASDGSGAVSAPVVAPAPAARRSKPRFSVIAATAAIAAVAGAVATAAVLYSMFRPEPVAMPIVRFGIEAPVNTRPQPRPTGPGIDVSISADGSTVAYRIVNPDQNSGSVAVRTLSSSVSQPVPGTVGDVSAFSLSHDGRRLVVNAARELRLVNIEDGKVTSLGLQVQPVFGIAWVSDEEIIYASGDGVLNRMRLPGGAPEAFATPPASGDGPTVQYMFPELVPGTNVLLYTVSSGPDRRIEARRLGGGEPRVVLQEASYSKATASGHLLFAREGHLMAARFNASSLAIEGDPVLLEEDIGPAKPRGAASFDVSDHGTLVTLLGTTEVPARRFIWKGRDGRVLGYVSDAAMDAARYPRISHDGRRVAATIGDVNNGQLWVFDLTGTSQPLRLTFDGHNVFPMWTPDDRHLVYWHNPTPGANRVLRRIPSDGRSLTPDTFPVPMPVGTVGELSPDGQSLMYLRLAPATGLDLFLYDIGSSEPPRPWISESFAELLGVFSPDGKWVAYLSDQTGTREVYVRPFPGPGAPKRVSASGGTEPRWSHDGRELFYQSGRRMFAVPMTYTGDDITPGTAELLFEGGFNPTNPNAPRSYDVAKDGRFLMVEVPEQVQTAGLVTAIVGFEQLLRERLR